jgi:DNA modification methylase
MADQPMLGGNGFAISRDLNPTLVALEALKPLGRETRKHPPAQTQKLQASIKEFGFVVPVVIDGAQRVVAGYGLVLAARKLGFKEVPAVTIVDLDEAKLRALRLALNRLGEDSHWDLDVVALEFSDVLKIDGEIDLQVSGFEMGEIDVLLDGNGNDEEDDFADGTSVCTSRSGDLWLLGNHRLFCGDALATESYQRLLGDERAEMIFADPPWNILIEGNVSGLGSIKHKNFAMAAGEMTAAEFESFLATSLGHAARYSEDGSIHFVCMHWTKLKELLNATTAMYSELKNVCVWNKNNAGMGSLYRSKHELVFVFKNGSCPHINNIGLGRHGRHRANVWDYPGQNAMDRSSKSKLALHPTAKPVALVMDAIRDCSNRSGIVLDPFGGIGTTLIAAEKAGRKARLIEIDPCYVDTTIKRWQRLPGRTALRADTQRSFQELQLEAARLPEPAPDPASR